MGPRSGRNGRRATMDDEGNDLGVMPALIVVDYESMEMEDEEARGIELAGWRRWVISVRCIYLIGSDELFIEKREKSLHAMWQS